MPRFPSKQTIKAVLLAGLAAGTTDILAAMISLHLLFGVPLLVPIMAVASGVLGPDAYQGGAGILAMGLVLHYALATVAAAVFVAGARLHPASIRQPIRWGLLAGLVMHGVMLYAVVPLTRAAIGEPSLASELNSLTIHVFLFGLPLSFVAMRTLRE